MVDVIQIDQKKAPSPLSSGTTYADNGNLSMYPDHFASDFPIDFPYDVVQNRIPETPAPQNFIFPMSKLP